MDKFVHWVKRVGGAGVGGVVRMGGAGRLGGAGLHRRARPAVTVTHGDGWESVRLEVIHGEARSVLEAQNETMADIDDKAMKSVRFNAILIGLLLTASRIAGTEVFEETLLHAALGSLVVSAVVGIVTYGESNLYVGPGGAYFDRAIEGSTADSE